MIRKAMPAVLRALDQDGEVEAVLSTGERARDGHILEPEGCDLSGFRANPVILWSHDADEPIARAEAVSIAAGKIVARIRFAAPGASATADRIRALVKDGIVNTMSVGFDVVDAKPIDAAKPRGGMRITAWTLMEASFVSVPADTGAVITARAEGDAGWKVSTSRNLPVEDTEAWDGEAAAKAIFAWAGGDGFEPSKARKGFLAYDSAKPGDRASYRLPIATVVDGRLRVSRGALRAAASLLPLAVDLPQAARDDAGDVLDHYEEKAGMTDGKDTARAALRKRMLRTPAKLALRGMYDVAQLAYLLGQLGYIEDSAEFEKEIEGDDSQVPAMLGEALKLLGDALIAMTTEEVAELIGEETDDAAAGTAAADDGVRGRLARWRRALDRAKAHAAPNRPVVLIRCEQTLSAEQARKVKAAWSDAVAANQPVVLGPGISISVLAPTGEQRDVSGLSPKQIARAGKAISKANHETLSGIHERMAAECASMRSFLDEFGDDGDPCDPDDPDCDPEAGDESERAAAAERERRQREADRLRLAG